MRIDRISIQIKNMEDLTAFPEILRKKMTTKKMSFYNTKL